jgi:hypothetical protein
MFLTRYVTKIAASEWFGNRNILTVHDQRRLPNIFKFLSDAAFRHKVMLTRAGREANNQMKANHGHEDSSWMR